MTNEEIERAAARAGPNLWRFSGLTFVVVENTIELAELEPIAASVQPEFADLRIDRRVAGPMAGGLTPEAALLAVFAAVAIPFLSELGKDAYRGFRSALHGAYKKAKTWANNRGYAPLAIEIRYVEPTDRGPASEPSLYFVFRPEMEEEAFERAMLALVEQYASISREPAAWVVVLEWNNVSGQWVESYRD